jgi:hypothetical protein
MQDYTHSTDAGGDIQVEFDNDQGDRDVQVDYIVVNGDTRQAEDQSYNTGVYDGECGGGQYSEMLHCNGAIGFGDVSGGGRSSSSSGGGSTSSSSGGGSSSSSSGGSGSNTITVRASGTTGEENINLIISGNTVTSWNLSTSMEDYTYSTDASGDIQVEFDNDQGDRDVQIDYIVVNGDTRQAEDQTYNTGVYANGECGGGENSEMLHCNGAIGFGDVSGGGSSSSSSGGGSSSSSSGGSGGGVCNWYGTDYPMCQNTSSGWGWENNQSCISESTCNSQ